MNTLPWNRTADSEEAPAIDDAAEAFAPTPAADLSLSDDALLADAEALPDAPPDPTEEARYREHALIAAAKAGDQVAFTALVDAHYSLVFGLACRTVQDPEEAAEIAQDVFLAAWRGLQGFRGEARFATWLYRITYRRCLLSIEQQRNRVAAMSQMATLQVERLANEWSEMQANMAEQEWGQAIRDEIALLPAKYQLVLLLRHFQDLSYEEIAQRLTIPVSSVKTHLFRARCMLGKRLQTVQMPDLGSALRERLPRVELPHVELPHVELPHVELPHVDLPDVGGALRSMVDGASDLLRGHLKPSALGAEG